MSRCLIFYCWLLMMPVGAWAADSLNLVEDPHISPDGQWLLFVHRGDIWRVSSQGGQAHRITFHPADDSNPRYSPDGRSIAYVSDRTGSRQVYIMREGENHSRQVTWHTEGHTLQDWFPDGRHLLVAGSRDHGWKYAQRLFKIDAQQHSAEQLLFNEFVNESQCSPSGTQLLFTMGGERWWRKGYRGARATQIWLYDLVAQEFTELLKEDTESLSPTWKPDGSGFYYCSSRGVSSRARNLWEFDLETRASRQITHFDDDLVSQPSISADGKTLVFSHLFDLYRLELDEDEWAAPRRVEITRSTEDQNSDLFRRRLDKATDAVVTRDGLEIAFIAGGDLWVMETILREPSRVTSTAEFESSPIFIDDDQALICVSWKEGQADIMQVTRQEESLYWWQNKQFHIAPLTHDAAVESDLKLSPDGEKIAYVRDRGELWIYDRQKAKSKKVVSGFSLSGFDFSPDSKWITYAQTDNDFNSDIWICPLDGSQQPVNISRHPAKETQPCWSSDGTMIAFCGRRSDRDEVDIYYLYLTIADHDTGLRDRKLKETLDAFKKSRESSENSSPEEIQDSQQKTNSDSEESIKKIDDKKNQSVPEVKIDFDQIHLRVRHLSIPNSSERLLGWIPSGKKLIFSATVNEQHGTYSIEFPDELKPKKITAKTGSPKGWLKSPERIFWLANGVPASQPLSGGNDENYPFNALQKISLSERNAAIFDAAWRTMRDRWYDDNFGNTNWDAIRRKYSDAARSARDARTLTMVIHLMLGELNGSHLGFTSNGDLGRKLEPGEDWRPVTGHLGARFDTQFRGPGWKIKDVIDGSPAADRDSRLYRGEIILSVDGVGVDPEMDVAQVLTGPMDRDIRLRVRGKKKDATEREVVLRPTSYSRIRSLLYQKWQDDNRAVVKRRAKKQKIGYLHIQGMNWSSFMDFQRELFEIGYGKDGLIIDVRDNGGGSTTDHLLTALTQPRHAITVPRGGGPGYPGDRMVYTTWHKPIVVLCNQNSYSNAEIFSHAIKTLGRGKLVGVPTAGAVISTGSVPIMDAGRLRLPYRGWFVLSTGEDMELAGAVPDIIVWPKPTTIPNGKDPQLNRAIKVLHQSIKEWKAKGQPELIKATERR